MARKKPRQWDEQRLLELERLFNQMTPSQLCDHFSAPFELLLDKYKFIRGHKELHISTEIVEHNGKQYRLIKYAAGFAEGVHFVRD